MTEKKLKLVRILLEGGVDPDLQSFDGKTALIIACCVYRPGADEEDQFGVVRVLLEHKASSNVQDMHGRTALMYAFYHKMPVSVIRLLLLHGSDPNIHDEQKKDSFSYIPSVAWPKYIDCLRPFFNQRTQLDRNGMNIPVIITDDGNNSTVNVLNLTRSNSRRKQQNGRLFKKRNLFEIDLPKPRDQSHEESRDQESPPCIYRDAKCEDKTEQSNVSLLQERGTDQVNEDIDTCLSDQSELDALEQNAQNIEKKELVYPLGGQEGLSRSSLFPDIPHCAFVRRRSCPVTKHGKRSSTLEAISNVRQGKALSNDDIKVSQIEAHLKTSMSISHVDMNILKCNKVRCLPKLPPIMKSSKQGGWMSEGINAD